MSLLSSYTIKEIKIIDYDIFPIYSLILLFDGRVASSSFDALIKIYNADTFEPELIIAEHTEEVSEIINIDNNRIASCSYDYLIKIFYICGLEYHCEYSFEKAHDDWIRGICKLSMNRIASCSNDKSIKIWNSIEPYEQITIIKGHLDAVTNIFFIEDKNCLLSMSYDNSIRLWNMTTYQYVSIIVSFGNGNTMLSIDNDNVIIGTTTHIKIMNMHSLIISSEINIEKYKGIYSMIYINKGIYFCGTATGKLLIYDISSNTIIQEIQYHKDCVDAMLLFNKNIFVSGSYDELKVWQFEYNK